MREYRKPAFIRKRNFLAKPAKFNARSIRLLLSPIDRKRYVAQSALRLRDSVAFMPAGNRNDRIIEYGNSGAGKTTLARQFEREYGLPLLDLDTIAWGTDWGQRAPLETSICLLSEFMESNTGWIVEGCYSDLIEVAIPFCTKLHFLNPGIERCVANCQKRFANWEKHRRAEDERSPLEELLPWVQDYECRSDEFSLARHRAIYDSFAGIKTEHV